MAFVCGWCRIRTTSRRVSRYAARSPRLDRQDWDRLVSFLCELGEREGLSGWVLFPTSDEAAAPVARRHAALARIYCMTVPPWETFSLAHDKRRAYA